MLEDREQTKIQEVVYRLANSSRAAAAFDELGLDPAEAKESLDFLSASPLALPSLIDSVFSLWPGHFDWNVGRFGDGSYPVFYSSLELETAEAEVVHHMPERFGMHLTGRILYDCLECKLDAVGYDFRPGIEHFPFLIEESLSRCQLLGKEARERNADAILTQSVRRLVGSNAPVFRRDTLNEPKLSGRIVFVCISGKVSEILHTQ